MTSAWRLTDRVVRDAQDVFLPVWESTKGDDGYVSFELDPLLEDPAMHFVARRSRGALCRTRPPVVERSPKPHDQGSGHAGRACCARGIVCGRRDAQRDADLHDAAVRGGPRCHLARSPATAFAGWLQERVQHLHFARRRVHRKARARSCPLRPRDRSALSVRSDCGARIRSFGRRGRRRCGRKSIFASTGTKKPEDPPWKYVAALAGSDIQTNPPATNEAVEKSGLTFRRTVDEMPPAEVLAEIDAKVDMRKLEDDADARRRREIRRSAKIAAQTSPRQAPHAVGSAELIRCGSAILSWPTFVRCQPGKPDLHAGRQKSPASDRIVVDWRRLARGFRRAAIRSN